MGPTKFVCHFMDQETERLCQLLGPESLATETDKIGKFLGPETDIMWKRYFITLAAQILPETPRPIPVAPIPAAIGRPTRAKATAAGVATIKNNWGAGRGKGTGDGEARGWGMGKGRGSGSGEDWTENKETTRIVRPWKRNKHYDAGFWFLFDMMILPTADIWKEDMTLLMICHFYN